VAQQKAKPPVTDPAALERALQTNPEDVSTRGRLIGYYFYRPSDDDSQRARLRHVRWLIEHYPDSPYLHNDAAALRPDDASLVRFDEYKSVMAAWQTAVEGRTTDPRVLENAVTGVRQVDYSLTVDCLGLLRRIEPTNPRWVVLLATQYMKSMSNPEFASKATADLAASKDLPVIGIVGQGLYITGRNARSQQMTQYAESLLERAHAMDALNPRWTASGSENPGLLTERDMWSFGTVPELKVPDGAIRVAPEVQAAKVIQHEMPQCYSGAQSVCPEKKTTLKLGVLIGKDGRVRSMHAATGDMSTIPVAMDGVRQWTYQPTEVKGERVEVVTEVEVEITPYKQPNPAPKPAAAPPQSKAPQGKGKFEAPVPITKVAPEFTPEASAAKFHGFVQVSLVVDVNGVAKDMKVMKSVGLGLDAKAMEAVAKWRFHPGTVDGKPVAVRATVDLEFRQ
jgi:TonB family protein